MGLREERVLSNVQLGGQQVDPSEPDMSHDNSTVVVTRTILYEDISGEGTKVDYSEEGWPEPKGSRLQFEEGFGAMQFYGEAGREHLGGQQEQGCVFTMADLANLGTELVEGHITGVLEGAEQHCSRWVALGVESIAAVEEEILVLVGKEIFLVSIGGRGTAETGRIVNSFISRRLVTRES